MDTRDEPGGAALGREALAYVDTVDPGMPAPADGR
jgi:hypothetical protein